MADDQKPSPAEKIAEGLREALAMVKDEAEPAAVHVSQNQTTPAQPYRCPLCGREAPHCNPHLCPRHDCESEMPDE